MDKRQIAAYTVIGAFMIVTVGHVANYAAGFEPAGWGALGWAYALAVDASIVVCAWLTRWATTQRWAWAGYVLCVAASGALNVAHIAPWSRDFGAWVYAIFPTVAQALLGFLARDASRFKKRRETDERVAQLNADLKQARAELKETRAQLEQPRVFIEPTREDFVEICADLDGGRANLNAKEANRLLVRANYWPVPDATARGWLGYVRDMEDDEQQTPA